MSRTYKKAQSPQRPHAVVVGLCAHGLSIARALHYAGVQVIALEANARMPGVHTRCADVRMVGDINGRGLVDALIGTAAALGAAERPVLYLTNDRMVETIGHHTRCIQEFYRLSWANTDAALLRLLRKDGIESRCIETGLHYPRTRLISDGASLATQVANLQFPVIVKPTRPISAFKTIVAHSPQSLENVRARIESAMPVIVQEFIAGTDASIRFGALYLENGEVIARFEGRKLRSRPMGHTTIAVSEPSDEVHGLASRFFDGLGLSGPVSLELKRGPDGTQWVIEPTVGRSDFWVGLCIANGVDLPLIEFQSQASREHVACAQARSHIWINGERDPGALAWLLIHAPSALLRSRVRGVYADRRDWRPFRAALARHLASLPSRAASRARRFAFG